MRVFLALPISEDVRKACTELQKEIRKSGTKAKLVEPENLHITLRFLGDRPPGFSDSVRRVLHELKGSGKIEAKTTYVGSFPSREFIRVVWLGIDSPGIIKLKQGIDSRLEGLGIIPETDYTPHITLARIKEKPSKKLRELIGKRINIEFGIDKIVMMKSELRKEGPKYEILWEIPL